MLAFRDSRIRGVEKARTRKKTAGNWEEEGRREIWGRFQVVNTSTVWQPKSNYLKGAKSGRKRVVEEMMTGSLSLPFSLFPARPPFRAPFTFAPSSLSESLEQVMKVSVGACGNVRLREFNNTETSYIKWRYPANAAVIPRLKNINILRQKGLELSWYFGRTSFRGLGFHEESKRRYNLNSIDEEQLEIWYKGNVQKLNGPILIMVKFVQKWHYLINRK